jgi:hypothetical protein
LVMVRSLEEWPGSATAKRQPSCVYCSRRGSSRAIRKGVACPARWMDVLWGLELHLIFGDYEKND